MLTELPCNPCTGTPHQLSNKLPARILGSDGGGLDKGLLVSIYQLEKTETHPQMAKTSSSAREGAGLDSDSTD